jgi:hypothetical protein
MGWPVHTSLPGPKCIFQLPMGPLHEAVCLRMVSCSHHMLHPEPVVERHPGN